MTLRHMTTSFLYNMHEAYLKQNINFQVKQFAWSIYFNHTFFTDLEMLPNHY